MKISYKNINSRLLQWAGISALGFSVLFTSCEGVKHSDQETEIREDNANTSYDPDNESDQSNANTSQDEMKIDTTSSASYGGTEQSTGRIDADTSNTGDKAKKQ